MKKIFTIFSFLVALVALSNAQTLTLSPATYSSSATDASVPTLITWSFSNGCTVSNNSTRAYSTGTVSSVSYIKYSIAVPYTVTLPVGYTLNSIQLTGYDNYAGKRSYITDFNGTANTDSTKFSFDPKNVSTAVICTNTITPATPITGSFTFTLAGNQTVLHLILNPASSGVENITFTTDPNQPTDVFSIDGRKIRTNVIRSRATEGLLNGVYIIDRKKVVVNRIR